MNTSTNTAELPINDNQTPSETDSQQPTQPEKIVFTEEQQEFVSKIIQDRLGRQKTRLTAEFEKQLAEVNAQIENARSDTAENVQATVNAINAELRTKPQLAAVS